MYDKKKPSRFNALIRITEEDKQFLKSLKSKKSLAGRLEAIVKDFKEMNKKII